ncbi:MAG: SDR family oxidoreductase [Meiothermus sp.]|nr:SDR family oxidoreductase [Meiothermus sp.]
MRSVLVTGASTGIGVSCALWLEARGFRVFAGVRKPQDAEALVAKSKGSLTPVFVDVTNAASVADAVRQVRDLSPSLDGLVNNAGIAISAPVEFMGLEDLRRILEVNTVGQIAVTQAFLPLLRPASGRIVMMSSISGKVSAPFFGAYSASKFALEALSDSLRRELKPWGLHVAVVEPGNIRTPIWKKGAAWGEEMRAGLPQEALALYGTRLEGLLRYVRAQDGVGSPPEEVARAVEHALTSPNPRTRYVVGRDAKMAALLLRLLPDWAVDRFLAARA